MSFIKDKILEFKKYKDNWNGYGASSFTSKVIENALALEKYLYFDKEKAKPDIFPTACNSLQIEYEDGEKYLEIEVKEDCYDIFEQNQNKTFNTIIPLENVYEVINIIKLFYRPETKNMCLFTGAFNPPHIGHFHMIESANTAGNFDYIIFAISNQKFLDKKQKRNKDFAYSEIQRLEFILAMTYKCPNVLVFGVEQGYTYEVLCAVKTKYNCESLYFALGSDKLQEIGRWGYHDNLLKEFCFYILQRNDSLEYTQTKCEELFFQTKYVIGQDNKDYEHISATLVREKIKENKEYKDLVCLEVYQVLKNI